MTDASLLYFAYGSNMSAAVMRGHGGRAEPVGAARLEGWGLRERRHADIEPAEDEIVHGLVWRIDARMLRALDAFEDLPDYYRRIELRVRLVEDGRDLEVLSYRMTASAAREQDGQAFASVYARLCARAARAHGLPVHPLYSV